MNKPIQPGELCVIVGAYSHHFHIGRFVTAVKRSVRCADAWEVNPELSSPTGLGLHVAEIHLQPIRGDETPSNVTTTVHELETA